MIKKKQNSVAVDVAALRAAREAKGWTQETLAAKAGCTKRTIGRLEQGGSALLTNLRFIAEALDVEVSSLLLKEPELQAKGTKDYKPRDSKLDQHPSYFPLMTLEDRLAPRSGRYQSHYDLEDGSYHRSDTYHSTIREMLLEKKKCLVLGSPGAGKTCLAIGVGHEFLQEGWNVYYRDLTTNTSSDGLSRVIGSLTRKNLVLLDNAHGNIYEINNILCDLTNQEGLLLVTSRDIPTDVTYSRPLGSTHDISYREIFDLDDSTIRLESESETLGHIVSRYVRDEGISAEQLADIGQMHEIIQGDYNLLRFYLETWKKKGYRDRIGDIQEQEIYTYIYNHYLRDCSSRRAILDISAITQYEIDVDSKWIAQRYSSDIEAASLLTEGLVFFDRSGAVQVGTVWLRTYHPSAAKYFVESAAASLACSSVTDAEEFTLNCLRSYIESRPENYFVALSYLYAFHRESTYEKLLRDVSLRELSKVLIENASTDYIQRYQLFILDYMATELDRDDPVSGQWIKERLFDPVMNRLRDIEPNQVEWMSILLVLRIARRFRLSIQDIDLELDFHKLAEATRDEELLFHHVAGFLNFAIAVDVGEDRLSQFCSALSYPSLGKQTCKERSNWKIVTEFISALRMAAVPNEQIRKFCHEVDFRALGVQARNDGDAWLYVICYLNELLAAEIPKDDILEFCRELDFDRIGCVEKNKGFEFKDVMCFLAYALMAGIPHSQVIALLRHVDFKALGNSANNSEERFFGKARFVLGLMAARIPSVWLQEFCGELDFSALGRQAKEENQSEENVKCFLDFIRMSNIPRKKIRLFCESAGMFFIE